MKTINVNNRSFIELTETEHETITLMFELLENLEWKMNFIDLKSRLQTKSIIEDLKELYSNPIIR